MDKKGRRRRHKRKRRVLDYRASGAYLGVSPSTIKRLVEAGELPFVDLSPRRKGCDIRDLDARIEQRKRWAKAT